MKYYKVTWLCNSGFGGEKHYIGMEAGLFFIDENHRFFELLKRCQKYDTKYNKYFANEYIRAICECEFVEITENEYNVCSALFQKPFYFSGTADRGGLSHSKNSFGDICESIEEQMDEIKHEIKESKQTIKNIYKECLKNPYYPPGHIYFSRYEEYLLKKEGLQVKWENHGYSTKQVIRLI
jgi:hypothetical protein